MLTPQTLNRPAASAGTAPSAENNDGSTTSQPAGQGPVDSQGAEVNGNSAAGNGASGSDGDAGDRQRPSRAERRIHELTAEVSKVNDLEAENARLRELLNKRPDFSSVKIPELKDGEDITPEKLREQVIDAADQIVKLRMQQIVPETTRTLTQSQANAQTLTDIEAAVKSHPELDENSEDFDPELAGYVVSTFRAARKGEPNYRFSDLVKETFKLRKAVAKGTSIDKSGQPAQTGKDNRANGAMRPNPGTRAASSKSEDQMSAKEYAAAHGLSL